MMSPIIADLLSQEHSDLHDRLLSFGKRRIMASQNWMAQRYPKFNESELLLRNFRDPDQEDLELEASPLTQGVRKIVVPMSYAILQSILAWQIAFFTDRKPIIPVEGLGPNDFHPAILHEHLFEHQYDRMRPRGILCLLQWFHDAGVYGLGVVMNAWLIREFLALARKMMPLAFNGTLIGADDELREESRIAYEGNQIHNLSPYDFFPDPRLPIGRFQEGEFCGHRTLRSRTELDIKAREGLYIGTEFIPDQRGQDLMQLTRSAFSESELGSAIGMTSTGRDTLIDDEGKPYVSLHHLYAYIPNQVLRMERLVEENATGALPRVWVMTIANAARVIRLEKANLPYPAYPYAAIETDYNLHSPMNPGLLEVLAGPNYHLSWLVNSREANVRRSLNFELLYDPSLVEREDLENPQPSGLVRLKPDAMHEDIRSLDRVMRPMPVADVTQGHMQDVQYWIQVMEQVSGANRMMQGLSNTGRRAATEVAFQQQLAAGRMKLLAVIWAMQGVTELCEMQLENTKAFLSERLTMPTLAAYRAILGSDYVDVTPDVLGGAFRIPLLEQGIPTDKQLHVNAIKELLGMFMQNPEAALQLTSQINGSELVAEYLRLLGKKNLRDFFIPPGAHMVGQQMAVPRQALAGPAQVSVQPDETVMRDVERGNLLPMLGVPGAGEEAGLLQ